MRVLLISERFPPQRGGVGVSAERIARNLRPGLERLDVVHLSDDLPAGVTRQREQDGVEVFEVGRARREDESLQLLEQVVRTLHGLRDYTLLHGFYAVPAGTVAVLCARLLGRPSVVSVRGNDVERDFYRTATLPWTLSRADRVLCVSRELVRKVRAVADPPEHHVLFVPNSVDGELFRPGGDGAVELPEDTRIVLFTGEMRLKKGLAAILECAPELPEDVLLVLLGGVRKEERPTLERWSAAHPRTRGRLLLPRYRRDPEWLRAHYNRADLVLAPSLWDGMPNTVLEAMACARPVLATAVGGIQDLVEHGRTGWLLPLEQLSRLHEHIMEALDRPDRDSVGQAAREKVLQDFTPAREIEAHLRCYRELARSP
ncbi:MAG: glycosyltransferase family 4 protein [Armatimonadetes bacterium]|nr:glycosyltransferase family 4 protein [Armatimonadota bacterium]